MRSGRARAVLILFAALALASVQVQASPYHEFEVQTDTASPLEYLTEANLRLAQSFVPTADYTLTRASLYVQDRGNTDALSVRLVADTGGLPDESVLLATGTNDSAASYEWANYDFSPTVDVNAGTRYWVVARSQGGNGHGYAWRYIASNVFSRGNASNAVGNSWTVLPGDFSFAVYGWTEANVSLNAAADLSSVASGDVIRYTLSLTNTGTEDATDVWANATLDGRVRFVGTGGAGTATFADPLVSFEVPAVPTGTTTFLLDVEAGPLFDDGDFLTLPITVEFSGVSGRMGLADAALVEIRAPMLDIVLDFSEESFRPGGLVSFLVTLRNQGRETADHAWVNESLHPALTFLSDTAAVPPTVDGAQQSWHFRNVGPGTVIFEVTVQIGPRSADDTVVATFLGLDYTDARGEGLVRTKSNTVWFRITTGGADPWLWGSFAISATLVAGTYLAFARRRLRIEEVFLIHRSGVLLVHMSKSLKADQDSDILSGMFTAIMNFVHDAFHFEERQELTGIDLGRFHVHVRKGEITYLALVHSGKSTRWISRTAERAVEDIETQIGDVLVNWDGDVRALTGAKEIIKGYFLSPTGPSRSAKWFQNLADRIASRVDQTFKPMRPL